MRAGGRRCGRWRSWSEQVQRALRALQQEGTLDRAKTLRELVDIQRTVEGTHTWPVSTQAIATFLVTATAAVSQLVVLVKLFSG